VSTKLFAYSLILVWLAALNGLWASDDDLIPSQFPKNQRDNLRRFLEQHNKPDRYMPQDARIIGAPSADETAAEQTPGKPVKQYTVQIVPHRPIPGHEQVTRADVYYYRPNPVKGKPGITVRYTVDLTNGSQSGPTEVLLNHHTPVSHEELEEAVALAREKSPAVQELYKHHDSGQVHWEYLQMFVSRKHDPHEPGDRVVRLTFTAQARRNENTQRPISAVVNLTKGIVVAP